MSRFLNKSNFLKISLILVYFVGVTHADSHEDIDCPPPVIKNNGTHFDQGEFKSSFKNITEVVFPGLVGSKKEKIICKIKCLHGKWIGTLCTTPTDGEFKPLQKQCVYIQESRILAVIYNNSLVEDGAVLPHGTMVEARCKGFGVFKLQGDNIIHCHNGQWKVDFPKCSTTMLVTNFTEDTPPTILYKILNGSAWLDNTGILWVYPGTKLVLECITIKTEENPVWSWSHLSGYYPRGWSQDLDGSFAYHLILDEVSVTHSDQYTCDTPNGKSNTVTIKIKDVECPQIEAKNYQLIETYAGNRLGQLVALTCEPGYMLDGPSVLTCRENGIWSNEPPACIEITCALPDWFEPNLNLVEYNCSVGGHAIFRCSWGYDMIGEPEVECLVNGSWSQEPPSCVAIFCPKPGIPVGGFLRSGEINDRHAVGDLIVYGCPDRLTLIGESSILCTENGFWSHAPPICYDPENATNATDSNSTLPNIIYFDNVTFIQY